jgi:hypothetical protein
MFRFFRQWTDSFKRHLQAMKLNTEQSEPQISEISVPTIRHIHAEAAALFNLRRCRRLLSNIFQTWRFEVGAHSVTDKSSILHCVDSSSLAPENSSAFGKFLFEQVVAALGDDVKATLRFG